MRVSFFKNSQIFTLRRTARVLPARAPHAPLCVPGISFSSQTEKPTAFPLPVFVFLIVLISEGRGLQITRMSRASDCLPVIYCLLPILRLVEQAVYIRILPNRISIRILFEIDILPEERLS